MLGLKVLLAQISGLKAQGSFEILDKRFKLFLVGTGSL